MTSSPHHKNDYALRNYKNVEMVNTIEECDVVYSPGNVINTDKPVVYGPHFSVFPDYKLKYITNPRYVYIQPSQWVVDLWKNNPLASNLNMKAVPFGVNTDKFKPINNIKDRNGQEDLAPTEGNINRSQYNLKTLLIPFVHPE